MVIAGLHLTEQEQIALETMAQRMGKTFPATSCPDHPDAQERLWGLWGKGELLEALEKRGVPHKKGWKKEKLLDVLVAECPDLVKERLSHDPVFALNPQYASAATQLIQYAEETAPLVSLLCFA